MNWLVAFLSWFFKPQQVVVSVPSQPENTAQPSPKVDLLTEFCLAQRDFEGRPGDLNYLNNNPGNLKKLNGTFFKFKTYDEGFVALKDYVTRVAEGKHKAYPSPCTIMQYTHIYTGDPEPAPTNYANFLAERIGKDTSFYLRDLLT